MMMSRLLTRFLRCAAIEPNEYRCHPRIRKRYLRWRPHVVRARYRASTIVRAVGTIVASMPAKSGSTMPSQPVSVLFMNGTDDPINSFGGGLVGIGESHGTREGANTLVH